MQSRKGLYVDNDEKYFLTIILFKGKKMFWDEDDENTSWQRRRKSSVRGIRIESRTVKERWF